jgi:hypothetical protein
MARPPAKDSALASAGAELRFANGITLLAKFDGTLFDLRRDGDVPIAAGARFGSG